MTPEELDALRAEAQGVLVTAPASEWLADRLLVVIDALREARAALDRVRALHTPVHRFGPDGTYTECSCGDYDYPCATIRAIDGSE